ncbi:hypothetical protein RhiirA4_484830 [Rhizophagus irregularis]|uniref:HAT C-terminal dimerisation domain-containing protein n=2 Tax=Rhizophagus irregularis TaxID=588596 RepID=A0A2I1HPE0_9GLOM|nr:hypothetical protein RhiirA4_484830 [Rhizophagus irregularis]
MYYYRAWSGKEPKCILCEFDDFWLVKYPFDLESYRQFDNDIWRYWCYISVSTNDLGFVACRIFGICVNAASVERLWSCMGFLQTNRQNVRDNSPAANLKTNSEPIEDDSDDEITESRLENDFSEYLQGWAEMLEEEKNAELDEETEEQSNTQIDDVTVNTL